MLQDYSRVIACVELITLVSNPNVNTLNASTRVAHTRLVEMFLVTFALCLARYEVNMSAGSCLKPERGPREVRRRRDSSLDEPEQTAKGLWGPFGQHVEYESVLYSNMKANDRDREA